MADDDSRWMTFQALAEARGTTKRAAVILVRRHKWPKQRNNEGHVIALVPAKFAEAQTTGSEADPVVEHARHDADHTIAVLERAIDALKEAHAGERAALLGQTEELRAAAQQARERVAQLEAADARRRGQGRWARLRAAWRGE